MSVLTRDKRVALAVALSIGLIVGLGMLWTVMTLSPVGRTIHLEDGGAGAVRTHNLVIQMRDNLRQAALAGMYSILADNAQSAAAFANEAVQASARVEQTRREISGTTGMTDRERALKDEFDAAWSEFRRIDGEFLALATQHTDARASMLAFGRSQGVSAALDRFDKALATFMQGDQTPAVRMASRALISALRVQALLGARIAAADADKGGIEEEIGRQQATVRANLDALGGAGASEPALSQARSAFEEFSKACDEVVALSRQDAAARGKAIALDDRRRALDRCETALAALEEGIRARLARPGR